MPAARVASERAKQRLESVRVLERITLHVRSGTRLAKHSSIGVAPRTARARVKHALEWSNVRMRARGASARQSLSPACSSIGDARRLAHCERELECRECRQRRAPHPIGRARTIGQKAAKSASLRCLSWPGYSRDSTQIGPSLARAWKASNTPESIERRE